MTYVYIHIYTNMTTKKINITETITILAWSPQRIKILSFLLRVDLRSLAMQIALNSGPSAKPEEPMPRSVHAGKEKRKASRGISEQRKAQEFLKEMEACLGNDPGNVENHRETIGKPLENDGLRGF